MKRYLFLLVALCIFVPCPSIMAADTDKDSEYLGEQFAEVSYYDNNAGGTWTISYYKGRRNEEAYKDFTVYPVVTNNKDYGNWKGENDQCVNLFMTVDSSCTDDFIYITRKDVLVRDGSNKEDSSRWVELKCQLMDYNENIWFNYDSRFPDYLKQFMTEEDKEYSQFATGLNEYIKEQNFRFAVSEFSYDSNLTYTRDWSQSYYTSSYITIYPEGDSVNSLREQGKKVISSQFEGEFRSGTMSGMYTIYNFCIPFLYRNDFLNDIESEKLPTIPFYLKTDNSNEILWGLVSVGGKHCTVTWQTTGSFYEGKENSYYIEGQYLKTFQLGADTSTLSEFSHWLQFVSVRDNVLLSNKCIEFNTNDIDNAFKGSPYREGSYYAARFRICEKGSNRKSNYVRIIFDGNGNIYESAEVVDSEDPEKKDTYPDGEDPYYKYGDDSYKDGTPVDGKGSTASADSGIDNGVSERANMMTWVQYVSQAISAVGSFPTLLGKLFVAMPQNIIVFIWTGFAFIVIARILGR